MVLVGYKNRLDNLIKILCFLASTWGHGAAAESWPTQGQKWDVSVCPTESFGQPILTAFAGCDAGAEGVDQALCTQGSQGLRICKCHPVAKACDDEDQDVFYLQQYGHTVQTWCDSSFLGDLDFDAQLVDLDHKGGSELVIANRNSTSVGIGISDWTLAIFSVGDWPRPPVITHLEDYGLGSLAYVAKSKRCFILQTQWQEGVEPKRGEGLYFVGRLLRYPHMTSVYGQKSRRYLYRFEVQRGCTINERNFAMPLRWLLTP